jgi:hypothetical protein
MTKQKTNWLSQKAIDLLSEAAKDKDAWKDAMRDPLTFLGKNGEILSKGTELRLYENDWDPRNLSLHESVLDAGLPQPNAPVGGGAPTCPPGQLPYKTIRQEKVCLKWGIDLGALEWIADDSNPLSGHFGHPNATTICLEELVTEVSAWVCLRPIKVVLQRPTLQTPT